MRIVICDDDIVFAQKLECELRKWAAYSDLQNEYVVYSSAQRMLASDLSGVHIVFLDIEMPGCDGIEAAHVIRQQNQDIMIVFVTSWIQYAPAGYKVNAFRYLLKDTISSELHACMNDARQKLLESNKSLAFQLRDGSREIILDNILYLEGTSRRCVLVHLRSETQCPMECVGKLSEYDEKLQRYGFLRIQKSYIVNMSHIDRIKNRIAVLRNGIGLKVSERDYADVCKKYLLWRGQRL